MNHRRHTILIAIAAVVFSAAWCRNAVSQAPSPAEPPKLAGEIEYVGPDTYLLLDKQGRPQPVLGMTYEEFVAAWKKLQNAEAHDGKPRFTIDELRIAGRTQDDHAELDVEVTVKSLTSGPLKVPLGMADAILLDEPRLEVIGVTGPAATQSFVDYEPQAGGFVAWLDGEPNERRKLTLRILRPLLRDGNESSLELNLPRALVSHLTLTVPTPIVDAATTDGALLTKEAASDGSTRLGVDGPAGDFRLSWNTAAAQRSELATVLSATGAIAISIDGHSIRSDAHLTVRSYGGSFDRFRVRLPPGAKLIQDRPRDTTTAAPDHRVIVDDRPSATADGSQIVTVELAEKQLGPVEVDLLTEQPLSLPTAERAVELAGFEVLGAVRQFGDVAIEVADDWQLRWENGPYVRQVERAELPTPLRDVQPTVAFQYDRQPWSLRALVVARPMVVHVTPDYALELGTDEARLRVQLVYQVPGARAFEFHVQLQGWELTAEPIESGGLVDRDGVLVSRDGVLVLPLTKASSRRAEITFGLRRTIARDAVELKLPLPVPEADTVAAAELVVAADAAIELLPDMPMSRGLSPTPVTSDEPIAAAEGGEQLFHYRSFVPDAVFAAQRSIRPSEATVEIDTALAVDWQQLRVTQDIAYRVEYQPLVELSFDVPNGWSIDDDQIEIVPATPGAAPIVVVAVTESASHGRPTRIARATLAQPRLGRFHVRIGYRVADSVESLGVGRNTLMIPQPAGARIAGHRVRVDAAANVAVALDESANSPWRQTVDAGAKSALVLSTAGPAAELPLMFEPIVRDRPQATTVERAWLQTWQAGSTIQDRAAFKFRTTGSAVTVELPPLTAVQEVEVLADGELARVSTRQEGRLIVELPRSATASVSVASHTLELRYRRPAPVGLVTRHQFTPPQLVGTSSLSEIYWQVVLPGDRHVVHTPGQLVPVDAWQWFEVFWGRRATKTQAELETWVGTTSQLGPSATHNAYLYSGLAPMASIEMSTAPRWLIVLVASGAVLAVVSLWMYVPMVRRGWIGVLLAAIVASLAVAYPGPAVLVGQAAVLGVILAAVALVLRQWTPTRTVTQPPATSGSTNLRMRSSLRTDSYITPSLSHSSSGTPTAPLAVPEVDR